MKSITIKGITYKGSLLFEYKDTFMEGTLQGFALNPSLESRIIFKKLIGQIIQCTISKNNLIRYKNIENIKTLLEYDVLKINEIELEESKIFSAEEKKDLIAISKGDKQQYTFETEIINLLSQRNLLKKYFSKSQKLQLAIEYLSEDIIFKIEEEKRTIFFPVKLQNIEHYFQLVNQSELTEFLNQHKTLKVQLLSPTFNIKTNRYECQCLIEQEIEECLLKRGWGTIKSKNMCKMKSDLILHYRSLQKSAQDQQIGIYQKPFEIFNLVYTSANYIANVEEVLEGHILRVRNKKDQIARIQLAYLICPAGKDLGAFECREFARKNLIGKEVNVLIKKKQEFITSASIVRLSDNKDFETLLVENGLGFIKEENIGSIICNKLQVLSKKAKDKRKGLYDEENIGLPKYEDLTSYYNKKDPLIKEVSIQKKMNFLKTLEIHTEGVLEKMISPTTFIIRLDAYKKIIRVKLEGVNKNTAHSSLPEAKQLVAQIEGFYLRNLNQRSVYLELTDFDANDDNFSGFIRLKQKGRKVPLQFILIRQGYVYVNENSDKQWDEAQQVAKKNQVNIWSEKLRDFNRINLLQKMHKQFKGQISWIQNRQTMFIQPVIFEKLLMKVYKELNSQKLQKLAPENVVQGNLCACLFEGEYARASILSIQSTVLISFIDWGNRGNFHASVLMELPENLKYIPSLCCEVRTTHPKLAKANKDNLQKVKRQFLGKNVKVTKNYGNSVNLAFLK